jgi:hypothetical protein
MNRKTLQKELKGKGYIINVNNVDFRVQDCTNYFNEGNPILKVSSLDKDKKTFELLCVGDIRIYSKKKSFVYKGGNPDGKLTRYLKKNGEWENNNWFEITENGECDLSGGDVFYDIDSAVTNFLGRL